MREAGNSEFARFLSRLENSARKSDSKILINGHPLLRIVALYPDPLDEPDLKKETGIAYMKTTGCIERADTNGILGAIIKYANVGKRAMPEHEDDAEDDGTLEYKRAKIEY